MAPVMVLISTECRVLLAESLLQQIIGARGK